MGLWKNFTKPWIKRDYTKKIFFMKVNYIIKHLDSRDKIKIKQGGWQERKTITVIREIEAGKHPLKFEPIRLVLHNFKEQFRVEDGISRLRAFRMKGIKIIKVELRLGKW
jgi:hypothetical protein